MPNFMLIVKVLKLFHTYISFCHTVYTVSLYKMDVVKTSEYDKNATAPIYPFKCF